MKIRNAVLCVLGLLSGAFATSGYVAEYCAEIVNDSTYRPRLVKDLNIPITKWEYPDTVPCTHTPCRARWDFENEVEFPYDIVCRDKSLNGLLGGGSAGIAVCADCARYPIKIPRLDKITLYGVPLSREGSCCSEQNDDLFYMRNARESLKQLYGLVVSGKWTAELHTNGDVEFPIIVQNYGAKLVGECSDSIPALDYCVNPKDGSLHLMNRYEVLPDLHFGEGDSMACEGFMEVEKSFALDFGRYGQKMLAHFTEADTCHGMTLVDTKVFAPVPEFIGSEFLKGVPLKKFYGKVVPVVSKNRLTCNCDVIERNSTYRSRIVGACGKNDLRPKVDQNLRIFEQTKELQFHGKLVTQWIVCGEGYICPNECIEVKDLLK